MNIFLGTITGAFAGTASILGLYAIVFLLSRVFEPDLKPKLPLGVLIFGLIFKVPALGAGWLFTRTLGTAGLLSFGAGIVLVYCLAVGWMITSSRSDQTQ